MDNKNNNGHGHHQGYQGKAGKETQEEKHRTEELRKHDQAEGGRAANAEGIRKSLRPLRKMNKLGVAVREHETRNGEAYKQQTEIKREWLGTPDIS